MIGLRLIRRCACWLVRLAATAVEQFEHELQQARHRRYLAEHPPCAVPRLLTATGSPEMDAADEFLLRQSLRRALCRFSPEEQTPEA